MGHPTIYPTGVTVYDPRSAGTADHLSGPGSGRRAHGHERPRAHVWKGVLGMPTRSSRRLPHVQPWPPRRQVQRAGRHRRGCRSMGRQCRVVLRPERVHRGPGYEGRWMARFHHDFQREGNPVGYYAPGLEPKTDSGNTLVLAHRNARNSAISDKLLLDDLILEVNWEGEIVWEWNCHEHFEEFGFREGPKNTWPQPQLLPTKPRAWATGCTSTPCRSWAQQVVRRRRRALPPDNIIVDGAMWPTSPSSSTRRPARSSGNWAPTTTRLPNCGPSAGSSASTTAT